MRTAPARHFDPDRTLATHANTHTRMAAFGSSATTGTGYLSGGRTKGEDRAGAWLALEAR